MDSLLCRNSSTVPVKTWSTLAFYVSKQLFQSTAYLKQLTSKMSSFVFPCFEKHPRDTPRNFCWAKPMSEYNCAYALPTIFDHLIPNFETLISFYRCLWLSFDISCIFDQYCSVIAQYCLISLPGLTSLDAEKWPGFEISPILLKRALKKLEL